MNTGLQDAYNLAWKLALVVDGAANDSLLDSYASEREPVADRLLGTTDRAFTLIVSDNWLGALFRTRILARLVAFAMGCDAARRFAFGTVAQIGINYRSGPLARGLGAMPKGAPQPGDRFPWMMLRLTPDGSAEDLFRRLDDTCFNLLLIGQSTAPADLAPLGDLVKIHHLLTGAPNDTEFARWRIPAPSYFLLRPDGYIGLAGVKYEHAAVTRYRQDQLRMKSG